MLATWLTSSPSYTVRIPEMDMPAARAWSSRRFGRGSVTPWRTRSAAAGPARRRASAPGRPDRAQQRSASHLLHRIPGSPALAAQPIFAEQQLLVLTLDGEPAVPWEAALAHASK